LFFDDPDVQLMLKVKEGDDKAFEKIVDKHQKGIYNFVFRLLHNEADAEEITQEVFLRAFRSSFNYEPKAKLNTWLFTIARNLCLNKIRDDRFSSSFSINDDKMDYEIPDTKLNPVTSIESKDLREAIVEAITKLPLTLRMPVILCKYHGMTCAEAGEILGCSENAVKLRVMRAKEILSKLLKDFL